MSARDKFHEAVKNALKKEQWQITDDPLHLEFGDVELLDMLEVRGLGVLNIRQMFGDTAVKKNKYLRLIVHLTRPALEPQPGGLERITGDLGLRRVLDLDVPMITLPVMPGRNLAVLTEAATLTYRDLAEKALNSIGRQYFTVTVCGDEVAEGKPAPDPFLLAAQCLGYHARKCVVFEDSPSGVKSAVASGATVIAVCTSHAREKIEGLGAHYIVNDMRDVEVQVVPGNRAGDLQFTVHNAL